MENLAYVREDVLQIVLHMAISLAYVRRHCIAIVITTIEDVVIVIVINKVMKYHIISLSKDVMEMSILWMKQ